jgi:hypothetical protein
LASRSGGFVLFHLGPPYRFLWITLLALYISSSECLPSCSLRSKSQDKGSIERPYLPQSSISSQSFPVVRPPSKPPSPRLHCCLPLLLGVDILVIPSRAVPRLTDLSPVEVRGDATNRTIFKAPVRCHPYSTLFNSLDVPLNAPTKRMA